MPHPVSSTRLADGSRECVRISLTRRTRFGFPCPNRVSKGRGHGLVGERAGAGHRVIAFSYATLGELVASIIGWDLILELALGPGCCKREEPPSWFDARRVADMRAIGDAAPAGTGPAGTGQPAGPAVGPAGTGRESRPRGAGSAAQQANGAARSAQLAWSAETAILDALDAAVIVTDPAGAVLHANAAAEKMYGHPLSVLLGSNVRDSVGHRYRQNQVRRDHAAGGRRYPLVG